MLRQRALAWAAVLALIASVTMFSQQQYAMPTALGFFGGPLVDGGGYVWIPGRGPVPIGPWRPDFGGAFLPQMSAPFGGAFGGAFLPQMAAPFGMPMTSSFASIGATLDALPAETAIVRRFVTNALGDEKTRKLVETKNGQLDFIKQALEDADVRAAVRAIAARQIGVDARDRRALQEWIEIGVGVLVIGGLIVALMI